MPAAQVNAWAANLTLAGMESKLHAFEIWVAETDGRIVAWGGIRADRLQGLYVDPRFANRGIGTELLTRLEARMRERGVRDMRADASANAVTFYLRRGYRLDGSSDGAAQPIVKKLS